MKIASLLLCLSMIIYSGSAISESRNCTDSIIVGVGPHANPQGCKDGDIVKLQIKRIPELCDFDKAITCQGEDRRTLCYCVLNEPERKKR